MTPQLIPLGHRIKYFESPEGFRSGVTASSVAKITTLQGWVRELVLTNTGGAAVWAQFFDLDGAASAPADSTAVERPPIYIPASGTVVIATPQWFNFGCRLVSSSTSTTKTASGTLYWQAYT